MKNITLIGVPMDYSSYGHEAGTKLGPDSLRKLGLRDILKRNDVVVDGFTDIKVSKLKPIVDPTSKHESEIVETCERVKRVVFDAIENNTIPVTIGGDHSVSLGSISGLLKKSNNVGVIWIDAHADANTPETTTSGNLHGMVAASCLGHNKSNALTQLFENKFISYRNFAYIGLRNVDTPEKKFIKQNNIFTKTIWDIEASGIDKVLNEVIDYFKNTVDYLHISLDLDVVDEIWAPGVGIITKGGLTYREILYLAKKISEIKFNSLDVVELNPNVDKNNITSELTIEIISAFFGIDYGPYESFRDKRGPLLK